MEKDPTDYSNEDLKNYSKTMTKTSALRVHNDTLNNRPKASKDPKWNNILKYIWKQQPTNFKSNIVLGTFDNFEGKGCNTVFLTSDPIKLWEKLELLMASNQAGNTGTRNEIVSILDNLPKMKEIDVKQYKH